MAAQNKKKTANSGSIYRIFGLIVLVYVASMAWLEGPLAMHLYKGHIGPPTKELALPIAATAEVRKLETKSSIGGLGFKLDQKRREEEPNFLPRVLAFVFPQFHRDRK